jgi:hypothetical protein
MADRLETVRAIAAQSDHEGEREAALARAAELSGGSVRLERGLAQLERLAREYDQMARDYPMVEGLRELAERERLIRRKTMRLADG